MRYFRNSMKARIRFFNGKKTMVDIRTFPRCRDMYRIYEIRPIGTFVVLITVARPCGSRRVGLSFLSRGK